MRHWVWTSSLSLCLLLVILSSIRYQTTHRPKPQEVVQSASEPPFVRFDITPDGKNDESHWRYRATYNRGGKTARFAVEMIVDNPEGDRTPGKKPFKIKSGRGSFIADPTSENSELLSELKRALAGTKDPTNRIRVRELPFEFAVLGENVTHSPSGGFVNSDSGNWVAMKLFLGQGIDESEVYFNFERGGGKGEFSLKDEEYGDAVLNELAKVL